MSGVQHELATISAAASVHPTAKIWAHAQVREGAVIGPECIIGIGAYVDSNVRIGARCKIQNKALLYEDAELEDGVFIGPGVILTNDRYPRAVNPDETLKSAEDWTIGSTRIGRGASVGAGSIILPGLTIGRWALIGAGSLVTRDVPAHALVVGSPGSVRGYVCVCARKLDDDLACPDCGRRYREGDDGIELRAQ